MSRGGSLVLALVLIGGCGASVGAVSTREGSDVTLTPSKSETQPGSVVEITGSCGGMAPGRADVGLSPDVDTGGVSIPLLADGTFHGGLVIPPTQAAGLYYFHVECISEGFHVGVGQEPPLPTLTISGKRAVASFFSASPATVAPGDTVTIHGVGCILDKTSLATASVRLVFLDQTPESQMLEQHVGVAGDGSWTTEFTIPSGLSSGRTDLEARCDRGAVHVALFDDLGAVSVVAPPPPVPAPVVTTQPPPAPAPVVTTQTLPPPVPAPVVTTPALPITD